MRRCVLMLTLAIGALGPMGCAHPGTRVAPEPTLAAEGQAPPRAAPPAPASRAVLPEPAYRSPIRITTGRMTGTFFLQATPGASREALLHITITHGGYWAIFDKAIDRDGKSYRIVPTAQHFSCGARGCIYSEDVDISIPEAALTRAARSGLVLRISGTRLTYLAELPPEYVAGFVGGLAHLAARRAAAADAAPVPAAPAPPAP